MTRWKLNIALGVNDHEIDELKINTSLCQARLDEVVNELPDKQNTLIGERGIKLSGGQGKGLPWQEHFILKNNLLFLMKQLALSIVKLKIKS